MPEIQLYYIGTSKVKEIRAGGEVTRMDWGTKGAWTKVATPSGKTTTTVKYNATSKAKVGTTKYGGLGGVTYSGTYIPATAVRPVAGVDRTVDVRYYKRGYTTYTKTSALKKKKKMSRTVYTNYQYQLQYKDKPVIDKTYSTYADGVEYIYFADHYWKNGQRINTDGHLLHPVDYELSYSDVQKNINGNTNNNDSRDNKGSYVLTNVRANVVTLQLTWSGLSASDGADLLDTLNPSKDTKGQYNYLVVQYRNPATNTVKNGTFFAGDRTISKYPDGTFKEISVTLTEV